MILTCKNVTHPHPGCFVLSSVKIGLVKNFQFRQFIFAISLLFPL